MKAAAVSDLKSGLVGYRTWAYIAWLGVKRRYATSVIGPNWTLITNVFFIGAVSLLFAGLNSTALIDYAAFLAFGYLLWTFMAEFIAGGNRLFLMEKNNISNGPSNLTGLALKFTFTQLLVFMHNLPILGVVWVLAGMHLLGIAVALGAFVVVTINMFAFLLWGGTVCARYRDISIFIATVMRIAFFLTPILWLPGNADAGIRNIFVKFNPFHYFITIFREPAIGSPVDPYVWAVVGAMTLINLTLAWFFLKVAKRYLVYWIQ